MSFIRQPPSASKKKISLNRFDRTRSRSRAFLTIEKCRREKRSVITQSVPTFCFRDARGTTAVKNGAESGAQLAIKHGATSSGRAEPLPQPRQAGATKGKVNLNYEPSQAPRRKCPLDAHEAATRRVAAGDDLDPYRPDDATIRPRDHHQHRAGGARYDIRLSLAGFYFEKKDVRRIYRRKRGFHWR